MLFYSKSAGHNTLLVAVNLDPFRAIETTLEVPLAELGYGPADDLACEELLAGEHVLWHGPQQSIRLDPQRNPAAIFRVARRLHVDYESPSE